MSDEIQKGRQARQEMELTEASRSKFREETLDKAVKLAKAGLRDEAYAKLLMVVAIDGVKEILQGHIASATIEEELAEAKRTHSGSPAN